MNTFAPIPGFTHLHRLQPPQRRKMSPVLHDSVNQATALVAIALATYFGVRPPSRLHKRTFSPTLIACLRAGKDSNMQPRPARGPTRLLSSHAHSDNGSLQLVGTVICAGHYYGYFVTFEDSPRRLVLSSLEVTT